MQRHRERNPPMSTLDNAENNIMSPVENSNTETNNQILELLLTNPDFTANIDCLIDCANALLSMDHGKEPSKFSDHYLKLQSDLRFLNTHRIRVEDFTFLKHIGKGAFGDVHMVRCKRNETVYALKTLRKIEMVKRSDIAFFWEERHIMASAKCDWIVKLHYAFQDSKNLYMVMDYVPGGDLVNLLDREDVCEKDAKFYCAEVVLAIEAVHDLGYIHRDIKPDNVLIDARGHLKLTDFGTCIRVDPDGLVRSDTAIGTPDYISPEILKSQGKVGVYGKEIDWWSLGVFLYEMLVGETPFYAESLIGTYGKIMNHKESLSFPSDMDVSDNAKNFIRALLSERENRLGLHGAGEVKAHPFFQDAEWTWTNIREADAPRIPVLNGIEDTRYFSEIEESSINSEKENEELSNRTRQLNDLAFVGFTYSNDLMPFKQWCSSKQATDTEGKVPREPLQLTFNNANSFNESEQDRAAICEEQAHYRLPLEKFVTMEEELKHTTKQFEQVMRNLENEMVLKLQLEATLYRLKRESERDRCQSEKTCAELQTLKELLAQYENEKNLLTEKYDEICGKQAQRIAELEAETKQFREQVEKVLEQNSTSHLRQQSQEDNSSWRSSTPLGSTQLETPDTHSAERTADEMPSIRRRRCVQLTQSEDRSEPGLHRRPLANRLRWSDTTGGNADDFGGSRSEDLRWSFESDLNQLYRSHLRELTLDANELAGHCETIQDDLDNALSRIVELNDYIKQLKRARIKDETDYAYLKNQLDQSELRNRQLESNLSDANGRYQQARKELVQKEADLRVLREAKEKLASSLDLMGSCHREIERKYAEVSQECARRGLQIAQAESDLLTLRKEYQEQRVMKMEAVKKLENLLQNPLDIPYFSKMTKNAGRKDHRMEKQCKKLEQILGNERMIWSKEEGRLQDEIHRKDEEIKILGDELSSLREKLNLQICEINKLAMGGGDHLASAGGAARSFSMQQPKTNHTGSRYSAYSPVHVIPLQCALAEDGADRWPLEGLPADSGSPGGNKTVNRHCSIYNSANVIDKCEDRLEGWLQIPSKHNIKRNGWRKHFVVAKSGRLAFYESDVDSLPWFVIPADKLFHVRPVTIHDVMRVETSLLPRIFQILYDANIAPTRLLTGGQQHNTMKSDVINYNGHEFMVVGYRKSTICDFCEKPCHHLITPPAAVECTRCHFKCHKSHIDNNEETIQKCRVQEEAKASSLLILCSSEQDQKKWITFLSRQIESRPQ